MKSKPSHELLEKVMTIADTKAKPPLTQRDSLNGWGVYCHRKDLLGGSVLFYASTKFFSKLGFTRSADNSITVEKYETGDWELAVDPTYNFALFVIELVEATKEEHEFLRSAPNTLNERITVFEQKVVNQPIWSLALCSLYITARRFKDAERALVKWVDTWSNVHYTHAHLGGFYMQAFRSNIVNILKRQWFEDFHMDVKDLGYTYNHTLELAKRHIQEAQRLAPPKDKELQNQLRAALSDLKVIERHHS